MSENYLLMVKLKSFLSQQIEEGDLFTFCFHLTTRRALGKHDPNGNCDPSNKYDYSYLHGDNHEGRCTHLVIRADKSGELQILEDFTVWYWIVEKGSRSKTLVDYKLSEDVIEKYRSNCIQNRFLYAYFLRTSNTVVFEICQAEPAKEQESAISVANVRFNKNDSEGSLYKNNVTVACKIYPIGGLGSAIVSPPEIVAELFHPEDTPWEHEFKVEAASWIILWFTVIQFGEEIGNLGLTIPPSVVVPNPESYSAQIILEDAPGMKSLTIQTIDSSWVLSVPPQFAQLLASLNFPYELFDEPIAEERLWPYVIEQIFKFATLRQDRNVHESVARQPDTKAKAYYSVERGLVRAKAIQSISTALIGYVKSSLNIPIGYPFEDILENLLLLYDHPIRVAISYKHDGSLSAQNLAFLSTEVLLSVATQISGHSMGFNVYIRQEWLRLYNLHLREPLANLIHRFKQNRSLPNTLPADLFERCVIGIDFGTTHTVAVVSVVSRNQQGGLTADQRVIQDENNQSLIPSIIVKSRYKVLVGEAARARIGQKPAPIRFIKRNLGKQSEQKKPTPEQIVTTILKYLKSLVEGQLDVVVNGAIIAVPYHFSNRQIKALKEAGQEAGFDQIDLLEESLAAAQWPEGGETRQTIMTYDFGGGGFTVTILQRSDLGDFRILVQRHTEDVNGRLFDTKLADWLSIRLQEYGVAHNALRAALPQLERLAEEIKWHLSKEEICILDATRMASLKLPFYPQIEVTRADFENMITSDIDQTIHLCGEALSEAQLRPHDLDELLMIGGCCCIPLIAQRLGTIFERPVSCHEPELAVAKGAARWATRIYPRVGVDPSLRQRW